MARIHRASRRRGRRGCVAARGERAGDGAAEGGGHGVKAELDQRERGLGRRL